MCSQRFNIFGSDVRGLLQSDKGQRWFEECSERANRHSIDVSLVISY